MLKLKSKKKSIRRNWRNKKLLNTTDSVSRRKKRQLSKLKESEMRKKRRSNVFVNFKRRLLIDKAKLTL